MSWNETGEWFITEPETLLPVSFTSRLAIKASGLSNYRSSWYWAGFCYQYLSIPVVGLTRINQKINIAIEESILFVPNIFKPNYQLKFIKAEWIGALTLTIYEDSMPINFEPAPPTINIPNNFAGSALSVTVPLSTTSVSFLAASPNRKKLIVANNSNQDLFIDLDATASVADHAIKIPKVSASGFIASYELESYTGVVSGIWAGTGTGAALVREMVL